MLDFLSTASLGEWILRLAIWLTVAGLTAFFFLKWMFKRQWLLYRNLKRPVIVLRPINSAGDVIAGGDLSAEISLLKANGFLNIASDPADYRTFDPSGRHCVVVLGYRAGMIGLADFLGRIKSKHVPLIVYTYGNNDIVPADKAIFGQYPHMLFANFPLTLLNHIFATVASYPYDRS